MKKARGLTHSEHIELLFANAASDIDREEHRPRDAAADKAYHNCNFQESKEKVAVKGVVL